MKNTRKISNKMMVAALSLAATGWMAQAQDNQSPRASGDTAINGQSTQTNATTPVVTDSNPTTATTPGTAPRANSDTTARENSAYQSQNQNQTTGTYHTTGAYQNQQRADLKGTAGAACQPQKINKVSSLIGSTVENQQGDKLGKIDEVVIDFDTSKVAYCVMSVEHKLFSTPKYIAVPLSALQPSADGTRVILNADKDKVAQAEGFDRNTWPSMNNPSWGAQPCWQNSPTKNVNGTEPYRDNTTSTPR